MINVSFLRFNKYLIIFSIKPSGPFWDTLVVYNGVFWESQGLDPIKQFSQPNLVDRSRPL